MKFGCPAARWIAVAVVVLSCVSSGVGDEGEEDWRLELLKDEGIAIDTAALAEMKKGFTFSAEKLKAAYDQLGAEEYGAREWAEWRIYQMGREALPRLRKMPPAEDPEVKIRLARIAHILQSKGQWSKTELVRHAVTSLLNERQADEAGEKTDRIFAEFFHRAAPDLKDGYRKFQFEADEEMTGLVSEGMLRMKGNHGGDGDQRLLLDLRLLSGQDAIVDPFEIEVRLGGGLSGAGAYHVGVSVGNVRALFHPGYRGGGFRLERVDTNEYITTNTPMGFDPRMGVLHSMGIEVKPLAGGVVALKIVVRDGAGGETFSHSKEIPARVIGGFDRIGLDRSGRTGGDGLFDDLVVNLGVAKK